MVYLGGDLNKPLLKFEYGWVTKWTYLLIHTDIQMPVRPAFVSRSPELHYGTNYCALKTGPWMTNNRIRVWISLKCSNQFTPCRPQLTENISWQSVGVAALSYDRAVLASHHITSYICINFSETVGQFSIYLRMARLTHWGRMTHICVSKLTIIGSDNGLSPGRRQAIIWTNAGMLLIRPLRTNVSEIVIGVQTFSFRKMELKMSSAKWRPFVSASMS